MMMILGVALWMFPRPAKGDTQYKPAVAEASYWLADRGNARPRRWASWHARAAMRRLAALGRPGRRARTGPRAVPLLRQHVVADPPGRQPAARGVGRTLLSVAPALPVRVTGGNISPSRSGAIMGLAILAIVVALFAAVARASFKIIGQAEVMVIERLGRFHRVARSGLNILIPFVERPQVDRRALLRGRRRRQQADHRRLDHAHRPARAGAQLPEPAGDHEGQRHHRHRRGASTTASPIRRRRRTRCRTSRTRSRRSPARRCATSSARWSSTRRSPAAT